MKKLFFAALAGSTTPAIAGEIDVALDLLAQHAHHPPPAFTTKERSQLSAGQVVTRVDSGGVAGAVVVHATLPQVWATVNDPAVTADPAVHELRLSADAAGTEVWYGLMGLPSPLADRQWVVRSVINRDLAEKSQNRAWERAWTEDPNGIALARPAVAAGHLHNVPPADLDNAIFTPVNRGGWLLVRLDEARTLVAYHARTDLGGSVPTWIVRDVARGQISKLLERVISSAKAPHPQTVPGGATQ